MSKETEIRAPRTGVIVFIVALALLAALGYVVYEWGFCRFYVPPTHIAVVTAKTGRDPKPGTILVERGEKGIWRDVLAEGRHFLDPLRYEVEIVSATVIPLGKVGVVTSKVGKELPPGEIIAADRNCKGVWRDVLGPGVYRLNPQGYTIEVVDAISIPAGYAGVVTSQTGRNPRPGEFARNGEKGVLRDILQPGLYYLNRYAYQVNVIEIGMNQVTMSGDSSSALQLRNRVQSFNNDTLDAIQSNTLNFQWELRQQKLGTDQLFENSKRRAAKMSRANAKSRRGAPQVAVARAAAEKPLDPNAPSQIFGVSRAVEFPSRDGFKVTLTMTVEFELLPESIARIYLLYGDLPQVVSKIILPQVLSVSRLRGSSYRAQEFIMGDGREKFQLDLRNELVNTLKAKNIIVHNAIIRNVEIPGDILSPIQAVSLAREQNLTNVAMQETARKLAELNTETELIDQRRREVTQETVKIVAGIAADQKKEVAAINAATALRVAEIQLKRSEILARTTRLRGETAVREKFLVENEKAAGELLQARALGDGLLLSRWALVQALNPRIKTQVIYAGDGTLWTDLKSGALSVPLKPRR